MDKSQEIDPGVVTKFLPIHLDSLKSMRHSAQQILDSRLQIKGLKAFAQYPGNQFTSFYPVCGGENLHIAVYQVSSVVS
jgi:hypothetical protein